MSQATHEDLMQLMVRLPSDFEPYGQRDRCTAVEILNDCSRNCRWYLTLAGQLGQDWVICANPKSPRRALLTFEHQGCPEYEQAPS